MCIDFRCNVPSQQRNGQAEETVNLCKYLGTFVQNTNVQWKKNLYYQQE